MNFELPPLGPLDGTPSASRTQGAAKGADFGDALAAAVKAEAVPPTPPPSVLEQMHDAALVAEKLRAQSRELHFEPTPKGHVMVQVRDLEGNVIRTVSLSHALEIATGAPLP